MTAGSSTRSGWMELSTGSDPHGGLMSVCVCIFCTFLSWVVFPFCVHFSEFTWFFLWMKLHVRIYKNIS